jgi:hypothetical protein
VAETAAVQELGKASADKRVDEICHLLLELGELFVARVATTARKVARVPTPHVEADAGKWRDFKCKTAASATPRTDANGAAESQLSVNRLRLGVISRQQIVERRLREFVERRVSLRVRHAAVRIRVGRV